MLACVSHVLNISPDLLNVAPCADDTVKFILKAKCIKNPNASKDAADPDELYINHTGLYSLTP